MVKIDVIKEAQAVVETTKGPAGRRLQEAITALEGLGAGWSLRIDPDSGTANMYKVAFQRAAVALGIAIRLRIAGNILYVMYEHGQENGGKLSEDTPVESSKHIIPRFDGWAAPDSLEQASSQKADESLARTKAELDAAIGNTGESDRCIWHPEEPDHEHDAEGICQVPEKSE